MIEYEERQKLFEEARAHLNEGRANAAVSLLEPYVAEHKNDAEGRSLLGTAYLRLGMFFNAEEQFQESLAINSDQYEIKTIVCRMQMQLKRWEDALEWATQLIKEDPNDLVARTMYESCMENVDRPAVGWERDRGRTDVEVRFTNE